MDESTKNTEMFCPGCGKLNPDGTDFCPACGAPLTSHATTDPLGTVFAEGYAARRALSQPPKPIIVVGVWAWMLPIAFISVMGLIVALSYFADGVFTFQLGQVIIGLIAASISAVLLFISSTFLYRVTKKAKEVHASSNAQAPQDRAPESIACLACGQSMTEGATQCPACGWSYSEVSEAGHDR